MSYKIISRQIKQGVKFAIKRRLPVSGEIWVKLGQSVVPTDVVGQATLPGDFVVVDVAAALQKTNLDFQAVILKRVDDAVEEGEVIAELGNLPLLKRVCKSPVSGRVAAITGGRVLIRTQPELVQILALVAGSVKVVDHMRGITIDVAGTAVEAAFCLGVEGFGTLKVCDNPQTNLTEDSFTVLDRQTVLLAGGTVDEETIRRAEEIGVAGIIAGSINTVLPEMNPAPRIPVVATEGFGTAMMAAETFSLLSAQAGHNVAILPNASAAYSRRRRFPQIIIADPDVTGASSSLSPEPVSVGSAVRILRGPNAMSRGHISAISDTPQVTESGIAYSGATVILPGGEQFVPWSNLECLD